MLPSTHTFDLRKTVKSADFSFAVQSFPDYQSCQQYLDEIGPTVSKAQIEVNQKYRALLHSAESMSFHTDHPAVDVIAWYCESQADEGGESLLLDFELLRSHLSSEHLTALATVKIAVPAASTLGARSTVPMLSASGLYYADWLVEEPSSGAATMAISGFRDAIRQATPVCICLQAGQALIINNKRVMHGRTKIVERQSRRHLVRHWIQLSSSPAHLAPAAADETRLKTIHASSP
jgi:hypothetical protein